MGIQINIGIQKGDVVAFTKFYRTSNMYKFGQISSIKEVPTPHGMRYDITAKWTIWEYTNLPQFIHEFNSMEKTKEEFSIRVYTKDLIKLHLRKAEQEDFIRERMQ